MFPKKGTIYIYEKQVSGHNLVIEVEETPDDISSMHVFSESHSTTSQAIKSPTSQTTNKIKLSTPTKDRTDRYKDKKNQIHQKMASRNASYGAKQQTISNIKPVQPNIPKLNSFSRIKKQANPYVKNPTPLAKPKLEPILKTETKPIPEEKPDLEPVRKLIKELSEKPINDAKDMASVNSPTNTDSDLIPPQAKNKPKVKSQKLEVNKNPKTAKTPWSKTIGLGMIVLSFIGMALTQIPKIALETSYKTKQVKKDINDVVKPVKPIPPAAPVMFDPMVSPDGQPITPINTEFSIIIPKIGVNASVIPFVNPVKTADYNEALKRGVAHASTSFTPDQNGTSYLFSHSTNYEWFIDDYNAIFYLVKDLEPGDLIVVYYKNIRYTYEMKQSRVVKPNKISYLVPEEGRKSLILQTCWPPGSVAERLLLFADLIEEYDGQT
ncbi:sortase [Patescibacteria group bacterium]